jgi:hypothetical protein
LGPDRRGVRDSHVALASPASVVTSKPTNGGRVKIRQQALSETGFSHPAWFVLGKSFFSQPRRHRETRLNKKYRSTGAGPAGRSWRASTSHASRKRLTSYL